MNITDPIADMLTRIRNGLIANKDEVKVPASKIKTSIAQILLDEGYIKGYELVEDGVQKDIKVTLKYGPRGEKVITNIKRISKPGLRVYCEADKLPKVLGGLGIAIISTSQGVMTCKEAREKHIGGEVLAYIW